MEGHQDEDRADGGWLPANWRDAPLRTIRGLRPGDAVSGVRVQREVSGRNPTAETAPLVASAPSTPAEPADSTPRARGADAAACAAYGVARRTMKRLVALESYLPYGFTLRGLAYALEVALVVAVYLVVGPALIVVNKWLLNDIGFRYPTAVASLGQIASSIFAFLCFRVGKTHTLTMREQVTWRFFIANMGTVGAASAAAIAAGQHAYLFLSVSFIQMLKSLTPVIISVLLVLLRVEYPSVRIWFCVVCITLGALIASFGEVRFHPLGVALALTASLAEGVRLVLTQKLLVNFKFPALESMYFFAPITSLWMILGSLVVDLPVFLHEEHRAREAAQELLAEDSSIAPTTGPATTGGASAAAGDSAAMHATLLSLGAPTAIFTEHWLMFVLAALLGVAVSISSMFMIKYTGSVSLKLLAMVRNAGLVMYAVVFEGEHTNGTQAVGYSICLAFFAVYVVEKSRHTKPPPRTNNIDAVDEEVPRAPPHPSKR